jgi:hypothetical protein
LRWRRRNKEKAYASTKRWDEKNPNYRSDYGKKYRTTDTGKENLRKGRERWLEKPGNAERLKYMNHCYYRIRSGIASQWPRKKSM